MTAQRKISSERGSKPMVRRFVPLHESVEKTINDSLGVPGLSHLKTSINICAADDQVSALIGFLAADVPVGVSLSVCADDSFILIEEQGAGKRWTQSWSADEAEPDIITSAVVAALRRRVIEPVAP